MLYVYAITLDAVTPDAEAVDETRHFGSVSEGGVAAVFTTVSDEAFSQQVIDQRANDIEWLGAIGYRHQAVVAELMKQTAVVPLRAFTLFSTTEALRAYLAENGGMLRNVLGRLRDKQEWTLRIELDAERWSEALVQRVAPLRELQEQIAFASAGKAFLLRKKLDDERKKASREAEREVVAEIERAILERLAGSETLAESRERRDGAFPQINVLIGRDEESRLQELHQELLQRYGGEGVVVALTGPWPPYSFAHA